MRSTLEIHCGTLVTVLATLLRAGEPTLHPMTMTACTTQGPVHAAGKLLLHLACGTLDAVPNSTWLGLNELAEK
jgi:hypothetical protein